MLRLFPAGTARAGVLAMLCAAPFCAAQSVNQQPANQQPANLPAGVTPEIQKAIVRGLDWLEANQANDGSWSNGSSYGRYPTAMTGMAGMALLASGSTPTRGKRWQEVRKATDFLLKHVDPETGYISLMQKEGHGMYGHGFATLFLASVYGMEEDQRTQQRLKRVLDGAVKLIADAQSSAGGWYYQPDSNNDEGSVTVTQIQALRACRMAGIVVDKKTIDRAVDYIKRCQNADGGICYKLSMKGSQSMPAITAAGVAVLYNAGIYDDQPFVDSAVKFCQRHLKVSVDTTGHHYYTLYYWSQALFQRGGKDWEEHYQRVAAWLLKQQAKDGSWRGDGIGNVYGTAVALTILQMPHSLVPIYQR